MNAPTCRSGGPGCDREATHGTFGMWWCEDHHAQLQRVAASITRKRKPGAEPIKGIAGRKARSE